LRIFQFAGISVYVHWSWLIVAVIAVQFRQGIYHSAIWNVIEYVSLFVIVLLHEFGHAFACRQVGGRADRIVLWPLGGVAFVSPPQRPGAVLWSIAAGPLVNVVLVPVTFGIHIAALSAGLDESSDVSKFLGQITWINLLLLVFNLMPVYPLDGGQILQSLLWFVIGRAKSLLVVSMIGLAVAATVIVLALVATVVGEASLNWWWLIMAAFVAMRSWAGFQQARLLARLEAIPEDAVARCPNCGAIPPQLSMAHCPNCSTRFDPFATRGSCPKCGAMFGTVCPSCGQQSMLIDWFRPGNRG
jgi:Zn-dependent protease